ncbi:MAG: hypothetical protein HQ568_12500 [Calditrichaeota bacterium]|nr:hypothetical protein [Calditrichota bacterium]
MSNIRFINTIVCVLCVAAMLLSGCADPEGPVGANVGDNGIRGEAVSKVIAVDSDTSHIFPPAQTGASPYLYVGSAYGIEALTLIKFHRPVTPFEWTVDTAYIELTVQGGIGDGELDPSNISVGQPDFVWTERDIIEKDSIPGEWMFRRLQRDDIDSLWRIPDIPSVNWVSEWLSWIDSSQIDENWIDTTRVDSGLTILLKPQWTSGNDPERLISFNSRSVLEDTTTGRLRPTLYIVITARDSADGEQYSDTLESIASDDIFLLEYDETVIADDITIGSGVVYKSFLHFDPSTIDTANYHNVVNRAILTLHPKQIIESLPLTKAIRPYELAGDTLIDFREAELKSFTNALTGVDTTNEGLEIDITDAVSNWIMGRDVIGWLTIVSAAEGMNIDRVVFHSMEADSIKRPSITVDYTRYER